MTLNELYQQVPPEQRGKIKVVGDRVFVVEPDGTDDYLLLPEGELQLIHSDRQLRRDIATIKGRLGA